MQKKNENKMTIDKNGQLVTRVTIAQLPLNSTKAHYVTSIHAF